MGTLRLITTFLLISFCSSGQTDKKHKVDPAAIALDKKAFDFFKTGNEDNIRKGIALLDSATTIDSNYFMAYHSKAMFLTQVKEYERAIEAMNNCIRIKPNAHDLYLTLAMMYENIGDTISSKPNFERSLSISDRVLDTMSKTNRDYVMVTTNHAISLIMLGDSLNANKILKALYDTMPDETEFGNVEKEYVHSLMNKNKRQLFDSIYKAAEDDR